MLKFKQVWQVHSMGKDQSLQQLMLGQQQNDFHPRSPYPDKRLNEHEGGTQTFPDTQALSETLLPVASFSGNHWRLCSHQNCVGKKKKKDKASPRKWGFTTTGEQQTKASRRQLVQGV